MGPTSKIFEILLDGSLGICRCPSFQKKTKQETENNISKDSRCKPIVFKKCSNVILIFLGMLVSQKNKWFWEPGTRPTVPKS